jgi:fructokinase
VLAFIECEVELQGPLAGLGIGSFGPLGIDPSMPDYGVIGRTPKPNWKDVDLKAIARRLDVPYQIDTDVNAAALGELDARAPLQGKLIYVTVGTGIGGGVAERGIILSGIDHPEMGHVPVRRVAGDDYPGCCPFHRDCLEGLASGPAIEARWGADLSALGSDHEGLPLIANYLGQLVVSLTLVMAPRKIIIGGGVSQAPGLLDQIQQEAHRQLGGYLSRYDELDSLISLVQGPMLGSNSGLHGAFLLAHQAAQAEI